MLQLNVEEVLQFTETHLKKHKALYSTEQEVTTLIIRVSGYNINETSKTILSNYAWDCECMLVHCYNLDDVYLGMKVSSMT